MLKDTSLYRVLSPSTTLPQAAPLLTSIGDPPPSPVECLPQCGAGQAHVPPLCYLVSHSSTMLTSHLFFRWTHQLLPAQAPTTPQAGDHPAPFDPQWPPSTTAAFTPWLHNPHLYPYLD